MNELENVKVGDKLIVRNQYGEKIETIVKVTKTLVITQCNNRYRKQDGCGLPIERWTCENLRDGARRDKGKSLSHVMS